jgi:hypothetical protein
MTDAFTCPRCGATSHNPSDLREGYCGRCHDWAREPRGEFSVWVFFPDDRHEARIRFVGARVAFEAAEALTRNVGGKLGTISRIIITDGGDHTVFEWKFGEGITFPTATEATDE